MRATAVRLAWLSGLAMPYVIGDPCIGTTDQSCIDVCPVDCIVPVGRMLVIHPDDCIDCGACVPVCPVEAIVPDTELPPAWAPFVAINAAVVDGIEAVNECLDLHLAHSDTA